MVFEESCKDFVYELFVGVVVKILDKIWYTLGNSQFESPLFVSKTSFHHGNQVLSSAFLS